MTRSLRTGALLIAALAMALVLIVPPDVGASSILTFNCGQVFGVNGPYTVNGTSAYYVVGFQSSSKTYAGFQAAANTVMSSCGSVLNVPGAISTTPTAVSPDGFVTGRYEDSSKVWHAFVMNPAGSLLPFNANPTSGVANAGFTRPTGITVSSGGVSWVVGYYLISNTNTSHAFAVQVYTPTSGAPSIKAGTWISFDISVAGKGSAGGVDGAYLNGAIVGEYPNASGKYQGYVMTIADLQKAQTGNLVTVVPAGSVATVTCSGAIGGYIHGISDSGRIVGIAFTSNTAGYAYYVDGSWSAGTYTPGCNQIPVPGASKNGQTWAAGISSDGTWIVGEGGSAQDWVYGGP
jgi:hypothetical protein